MSIGPSGLPATVEAITSALAEKQPGSTGFVVFGVEEFFGVVVGVGAGLAVVEVGWVNCPRFCS